MRSGACGPHGSRGPPCSRSPVFLPTKVSELKKIIEEKIGLAANKQKLVVPSATLTNSKTLAHYNIEAGTAVSLTVKTRGGR
ncbi:MAG: hypothetical protein CML43_00020 [Rhodobacteraceae bacterium]|nr:hypothetical protein [Paracoccaceae bacterium]